MMAEDMLRHAATVVEVRRQSYGDPAPLFGLVAKRWALVLDVPVTPTQVALCLIDLKLARLTFEPSQIDSTTDVAGYAACLREITS